MQNTWLYSETDRQREGAREGDEEQQREGMRNMLMFCLDAVATLLNFPANETHWIKERLKG